MVEDGRFRLVVEDNVAIWRYRDTRILAAFGEMSKKLADSRLTFSREAELSGVIPDRGGEVQAGFYFNPFTDLTIFRHKSSKSFLVLYGVDEKSLRKDILDVAGSLDMRIEGLPRDFLFNTQEVNDTLEVVNCEIAEAIGKKLGCGPEKAYSVVRYANFIVHYMYVSPRDVSRRVKEKLGVEIPSICP